jgi:hypothetical protein
MNECCDIESPLRAYCGYGATSASSISFLRAAMSLLTACPSGLVCVAALAKGRRVSPWRCWGRRCRDGCGVVRPDVLSILR